MLGKKKQISPEEAKAQMAEDQAMGALADSKSGRVSKNKKLKEPKTPKQAKKAAKKSAKELKKKSKKLQVPKTVQDTIPYLAVYPDTGIIQIADDEWTKSYRLEDINYQSAKEEEQKQMYYKYAELLNSFEPTMRAQITISQQHINLDDFERNNMLPMQGDSLDALRQEKNDLLRSKIREGQNELVKEKYLTVCAKAESYNDARGVFARLDTEIPSMVRQIGGSSAESISAARRLEILHDIYNPDKIGMFGNNVVFTKDNEMVFAHDRFKFDYMMRMGLRTKDCIAPDSFAFESNQGKIGDTYFRALYMRTFPQSVRDSFISELTSAECTMLCSINLTPVDGATAQRLAADNVTNITRNLQEQQKNASRSGYSVDLVSPKLQDAVDQAKDLREDLSGRNQKLYYMCLVVVHFADTLEQLNSDTKAIQTIARRHLIDIRPLTAQQENGLNAALPLATDAVKFHRSVVTECAAVFMPFSSQELFDRTGGMYYGINDTSRNLIMLNRRNGKNANGFIFGQPGGGKSFAAKMEMLEVLLQSDDEVIVVDPEGEYAPMAKLLNGEVVRIAPDSDTFINPFDITMDSDSSDSPISIKADLIMAMCETIVGGMGLTPGQRSLIDRLVRRVYDPYLASLDRNTMMYDQNMLPTLEDFYDLLRREDTYDALQLADGLEIYATGSQNLFAHHSNVEYNARFVVYDIRDMASSMKALGVQIILDAIWQRLVANRQSGKYTWFYVDEIYLLFERSSSTEFLMKLYKRARKYGGVPTGITQNISDLLDNPSARSMISNSEFVQLLAQSALDGAQLAELLNISPTQMSYISANTAPGHGLICFSGHIVPFVNQLSRDTQMYKAMTTKLSDVQEREAQK